MANTEITKDLKWLRKTTLPKTILTLRWLMIIAIIVLSADLYLNILIARAWAKVAGMTLKQAWQAWLEGPSRYVDYSGAYVQAVQTFDGILFFLAFIAIFLIHSTQQVKDSKRNARLLAYIEELQADKQRSVANEE